jgi:hypothetical protein
VQNKGGVTATSSNTRFYFAKDPQKGANDLTLTGNHSVPSLAPGATYTKTVNVGVPSWAPAGVYDLLVCADDNGAVQEVVEDNNCLAGGQDSPGGAPMSSRGAGRDRCGPRDNPSRRSERPRRSAPTPRHARA